MIAKIHHFPEKEKILNLAHLQSLISFNGARISIYPDFPPEVSEQRLAFDGIKEETEGGRNKTWSSLPRADDSHAQDRAQHFF